MILKMIASAKAQILKIMADIPDTGIESFEKGEILVFYKIFKLIWNEYTGVEILGIYDFIGNADQIDKMVAWLNDYYCGNRKIKFVLIVADTGNGKSYLVHLLSEEYNVEMFEINPLSIRCEYDLNNIIKSINLAPLDGRQKLIIIDGIDEFEKIYVTKLLEVRKISISPIIYIAIKHVRALADKKDGMVVHIKKPLNGELYSYLKKHNENRLADKDLQLIAKNSRSVRSALISLETGVINNPISVYKDRQEILNSIKARNLQVPITRRNIKWIFERIHGVGGIEGLDDLIAVTERFADFEYRISVKHEKYDRIHEGINPYFVNHMIEPIEKVKLQYLRKK